MTTPPTLVACLLLSLLLAAAVAPVPAGAVCVPRGGHTKPGPPAKAKPKPKPTPAPAPPTPIAPGADIVRSLCLKTDYPDLCMSSIAKQPQPQLPGGKRLDGAGVLRLAMSAVRAKAAEAKAAAAALASDPKTQPLARNPLLDCVESFDDIAYSLDQAQKALAAGDRGTTGTMLDTVRTDVDTCDQGFEEREELTPVMAKHDAELAKLSSNCLAIATAAGLR
ncbi:putative invertase inhibitor [Miscanthus floridulus]|uniref:putative invertase inhibitor n=1 Tax=Miscanthus floridulus TaxID=154761 RepID=UPI0034589D1E